MVVDCQTSLYLFNDGTTTCKKLCNDNDYIFDSSNSVPGDLLSGNSNILNLSSSTSNYLCKCLPRTSSKEFVNFSESSTDQFSECKIPIVDFRKFYCSSSCNFDPSKLYYNYKCGSNKIDIPHFYL